VGEQRAYRVLHIPTRWVRPHLYTGSTTSAVPNELVGDPGCLPFWLRPVSTFWPIDVYDVYGDLLPLVVPSFSSPMSSLVLAATRLPHGSCAPNGQGTLSRELSTSRLLLKHLSVDNARRNSRSCVPHDKGMCNLASHSSGRQVRPPALTPGPDPAPRPDPRFVSRLGLVIFRRL
jgi:hypothetical protein